MDLKDKVLKALETIRPALQSDKGDVELVRVENNKAYVKLTGACVGCPSSRITLNRGITVAIRRDVPEIEGVVQLLPDGSEYDGSTSDKDPWKNRRKVESIKLVLAVASGKGGVGKSTVAVNLALALKEKGLKIGLLDADVYGPSTPTMLGHKKPVMNPSENFLRPSVAHGIKFMSIGFYVPGDSAMIWRGPMVTKALDQFIYQVYWGELDCLVVDLPPGTGDAQLTLVQRVPVDGSVIVTTPSDVALIDARRGLQMFKKVKVSVLGIVENMSYFLCPHCGERTDIFAAGGGKRVAAELGTPFLGEIPLDSMIRSGGDKGNPVVVGEPNSPQAKHFRKLADKVWEDLIKQNPKWDLDACHRFDPAPRMKSEEDQVQ